MDKWSDFQIERIMFPIEVGEIISPEVRVLDLAHFNKI